GTKMSSPNVSMEEISLEDDERDSIEYRILMAYAQRRLSASKYGKLLENEVNVQKLSSSIRRKVNIDLQRDEDEPSQRIVYQGKVVQKQGKKQPERKYLSGSCLPFICSRAKEEKSPMPPVRQGGVACFFASEERPVRFQGGDFHHQTSETAAVNHIADKLAKLVASRSQGSPSDASFKVMRQGLCQKQGNLIDGSESKEHGKDEEKIIQTIVSLLRQAGDQLEEKIKKDRIFFEHFKGMLSYTFFKRITDLFLEHVSADSASEPGDQVQCTKLAFTMEVVTRLTAVDNHPMNLVLGFGVKYLRENFKPWIQDHGGW
ncbi:B2L14 protein, partial [Centropus bengalensis]|nr:B2L14 protein [Centropus bengalensis]